MDYSNGEVNHILLFGTFREDRYFNERFKDSYDLIGFNSNILAWAPQGVASFISRLKNKKYFIDPQTHAFQHSVRTIQNFKKDKSEWVLKKSIEQLKDYYGGIIADYAGKKPIVAKDFDNEDKKKLCENVLKFQYNIIQDSITDEVSEFLDFSEEEIHPEFVIAPYLFIDPDDYINQIKVNKEFYEISKKIFDEKPVFLELVIHQDIMIKDRLLDFLIEKYNKLSKIDGVILWIDNFIENDILTYKSDLNQYLKLLKELQKLDCPVINLHGSYFSTILSGQDFQYLSGVGHGIEYGESRAVIPVGGGVPTAKFYFPQFHKRIDYHPDAENILMERDWIRTKNIYHDNVCNCLTCKDLIGQKVVQDFQKFGENKVSPKNGKAYPTSEAQDLSRRHYLYNKVEEYTFVKDKSIEDILERLKDASKVDKRITSHSFKHIDNWISVLESELATSSHSE
ncbi:MAG: hypothetical protein ACLFSQ_04235 [Candidatus Zixiibacteriota bacterium]